MIPLAELKVRCGVEARDRDDDRILELLERDAVAYFELATNLYWGPVIPHVEMLHGGRGRMSLVRLRAPVVTLTGVETAGYLGSTTWSSPWALTAFTYTDRVLLLGGGYTFPCGRNNLRVSYTGGYAPGAEPLEVRAAVAGIVLETYRNPRRSATPVEAPDDNGPSALSIPGSAKDVIARLRRNPGT